MNNRATQSPAVEGRTTPFGAANAVQTAATVSNWTKAMPTTSRPCDHLDRPRMCKAYSAAEASVTASPTPTDRPLSESTAKPPVATRAASQTDGPIRWRSSTAPRIGVKTTYIPVTNPDTLAEVWSRPQVCISCASP